MPCSGTKGVNGGIAVLFKQKEQVAHIISNSKVRTRIVAIGIEIKFYAAVANNIKILPGLQYAGITAQGKISVKPAITVKVPKSGCGGIAGFRYLKDDAARIRSTLLYRKALIAIVVGIQFTRYPPIGDKVEYGGRGVRVAQY